MYGAFKDHLQKQIDSIVAEGLYKNERILTTPQGVEIKTVHGQKVLNFCANNYLGLSNDPRVMAGANYTFSATVSECRRCVLSAVRKAPTKP